MMVRQAAALASIAVLLATACTRTNTGAGASPSSTPSSASSLAWKDCGGGLQCATLQVPLDYSHPSARSIGLALIRKPVTDAANRIGSLLLNFGGPGESGLQFMHDGASTFKNLNTRFDLVSFDPRGVGQSAPVSCVDGPAEDAYLGLDGVLDDPQEKQAAIQADKDFAAGCQARSGDLLPFMDSMSTARDMDMIRAAVGDSKLTYLGFSYGTYIGQAYAHLFPTRVRALSLDGVVDATVPANESNLSQVVGFEQNLQAFLTDCRKNKNAAKPCAFAQVGDPAAKLTQLMQILDTTPMQVGSRQLTRALAMTGVLQALYDQSLWAYLDQALTAADRGDGRILLVLADFYNQRNADGTYANLFNGAFLSTYCLDWPVPQDVAAYDALGPAFATASPLFGPWSQYSNLQCAYWPVKAIGTNAPMTVSGAPPILLVGGTDDPATPYAESQSVNRQIRGSILLTRQGNGHTSYQTSLCAQAAEDLYLIDLKLPAAGTICSS
ncbi:MAG: alpha/beta hydrolase [Candidatus Dormiibacterota bacterium]